MENIPNQNSEIFIEKQCSKETTHHHERTVKVLKEVGKGKEITSISNELDLQMCSLKKEIEQKNSQIKELDKLGGLTTGLDRGIIENATCYLQSRELGLQSFGRGRRISNMSKTLLPSATQMQVSRRVD